MKLLITGISYFPEHSAGTEVYIQLVSRAFRERGYEVTIACGGKPVHAWTSNCRWDWNEYEHDGIPVIKVVRDPQCAKLADHFTRQDSERHSLWKRIFEKVGPDLVFSVGRSPALMGDVEVIAHAASVPVVSTLIHPGQLCPKGPRINADGKGCMINLDVSVCAACLVRSRGGLPGMYNAIKLLNLEFFAPRIPSGRLRTAIHLPELVKGFIRHWEELRASVSLFVAHSSAAFELLRINGVPPERILLSTPGFEAMPACKRTVMQDSSQVRFGFVGRLCHEKGLDTLMAAWRRLDREISAELHVWGNPAQGDRALVQRLDKLLSKDKRVVFHGPFTREETPKVYEQMNVLIVPSEWFDNCPFVINEAFASGVPVIGTDFGGISSMIRDGVDGLLFPMGDVEALAKILKRLSSDRESVTTMARNVRPPRNPREHVNDLDAAFRKLMSTELTSSEITSPKRDD